MANYANNLPLDRFGNVMTHFPAPIPAKKQYLGSGAASSVVTLTADTTTLEVGAIGGGGIALKWITTGDTAASVTASNFDHFIPANQLRRFVVPIEKNNPSPSIQGIGPATGLYGRVAWFSPATVSSVVASEY